jgi:hypothetical protein
MAQAKVLDARMVRVWRGTPTATPDANNKIICALTTRAFNQTKQSNTAVIPDCADPTVVAPVKRTILSKDATITGTGYYEPNLRDDIQTWFDSSTSKLFSFQLPQGESIAGDAGWYSGNFFLTTWNITAEEGNFVQAEMTWEADGPWSWTAGVV